MPLVVPDTGIWVSLVRRGSVEGRLRSALRGRTVYLCCVVVYELYKGCQTEDDRQDIDSIRLAFEQSKRLTEPTFHSWYEAANVLSRYSRAHGAVNWQDHLMDVLILLCAVQLRARVLTLDVEDFERWNQLLPAGRRVRVEAP